MGDTRITSPTVDGVVVALCADYGRRKRAIEERGICRRTDTELRYLNARIYDAVAEVVGEPLAEQFIKDIGGRIGYANTKLDCMSEVTYKNMKKRARELIAVRLHLID
jgi:hypothetical protein